MMDNDDFFKDYRKERRKILGFGAVAVLLSLILQAAVFAGAIWFICWCVKKFFLS